MGPSCLPPRVLHSSDAAGPTQASILTLESNTVKLPPIFGFLLIGGSDTLVGIGNALSDGYLVVYYPHLLVLPDYQGRGIGKAIMELMKAKYQGFHQHMLVADRNAVGFYERCGFRRAGLTEAMWIYEGSDH